MRNSTNCNSSSANSNTMNNKQNVTTTTVTDHNQVLRVEKVVFDNRIKRKNVLALNEKVAAIREYEKRPVYKRIGRMFQCSPDQIKRIVQQKDSILTAWEQRTRKSRDAKTLEMKVVRVSMLGKAVYEWIRRMLYYKDILITDGLIQKVALQFKSAMGLVNFFPHQDWCDKFRSTYKIFTCDSKALNVSYTQGHSVQIKDVMKDVLSECCPEEESNNNVENVNDMDENDNEDDVDDDDDDDCESVESVDKEHGGKSMTNTHKKEKLKTAKFSTKKRIIVVQPQQKPTIATAMQGLRQLVMQGATGGQKVLVATPIVPPGQKQANGPMTMTIIPLATLGQPHSTINAAGQVVTPFNANCFHASGSSMPSRINDDVSVPPPLVEIKQEIKEEPRDESDNMMMNSAIEQQEKDHIKIKKEYLTDDENDDAAADVNNDQQQKQPLTMVSNAPQMPTLLPAHVVSIPIHNKDMLEETSRDSLDDLSLSSLKKRMKIEDMSSGDEQDAQETQQNTSDKCLTSHQTVVKESVASATTPSMEKMPPMPPLTKAPSLSVSLSLMPLTNTAESSGKRDTTTSESHNNQELPPIQSFSEARKYLKLLEDFALERENFRLIGLITRADEVLRELDRKESIEGGDNEDVDID